MLQELKQHALGTIHFNFLNPNSDSPGQHSGKCQGAFSFFHEGVKCVFLLLCNIKARQGRKGRKKGKMTS